MVGDMTGKEDDMNDSFLTRMTEAIRQIEELEEKAKKEAFYTPGFGGREEAPARHALAFSTPRHYYYRITSLPALPPSSSLSQALHSSQ